MNDELLALLSKPTASVPDVGRLCYDLSRNGSYAAAERGEIPTIKVGRLLKVPTAALRRQLGLEVG
ncbi:hypothetical protein [Bradyrhizobium sp. RDM4]|uniref:hypothetical protein n=1 Tax=Bradyrhizobium sp. RDM4 TaxID=3378765 RepID=UPI0038FBFCBB